MPLSRKASDDFELSQCDPRGNHARRPQRQGEDCTTSAGVVARSSCQESAWGSCDYDGVGAYALYGSYSVISVGAVEDNHCGDDNRCTAYAYIVDPNTGTYLRETLFDEPCAETL